MIRYLVITLILITLVLSVLLLALNWPNRITTGALLVLLPTAITLLLDQI